MSLMLRSLKRTTPALAHLRVVPRALYYHPEVRTPKGDDFFITASFPDDFEEPTLIKKRSSVVHGTPGWDEVHATLSEASVKADRGEAKPGGRLDDTFQPEADLEPKIDEL